MATNVMMTIMVAMTNADVHTDAANMNADDSGVGRARTQQGQGKNRSDKCFHSDSLSRDVSSTSFAGLGVDGGHWYGKPGTNHSFQTVQTDTLLELSEKFIESVRPLRRHGQLSRRLRRKTLISVSNA
jgi:hypothetical protein